MATYIKTLKEDNGDIVYPQTNTDAVFTSTNETLETRISKYVTAEDIAQSVASFGTVTTGMIADDAITTAKIDDGAVTSQKIDWTTIKYLPGDSISIGSEPSGNQGESAFFITGGYVTSGTTSIGFNIPLPKSAVGTTPTFSNGRIWVRSASGNYVMNGNDITTFNYVITPLNNNSLGVQVKNLDRTAFSGISNNTPLTVSAYFTISFS